MSRPDYTAIAARRVLDLLRDLPSYGAWRPGAKIWSTMPVIIGKNNAVAISLPGSLLIAASLWPDDLRENQDVPLNDLVQALHAHLTLVPRADGSFVSALDETYGPAGQACVLALPASMPGVVENPRLRAVAKPEAWRCPPNLALAPRELVHPWLATAGMRHADATAEEWAARVGPPTELVPPLPISTERRRLADWYRRQMAAERSRLVLARASGCGTPADYDIPSWLLDDSAAGRIADAVLRHRAAESERAEQRAGLAMLRRLMIEPQVSLGDIITRPEQYRSHATPGIRAIAQLLAPSEEPPATPVSNQPAADTPSATDDAPRPQDQSADSGNDMPWMFTAAPEPTPDAGAQNQAANDRLELGG